MSQQTKRVIFWTVIGFVILAIALSTDDDATPARSYTVAECDEAELAFQASAGAIDRMEAEGLSEPARNRFGTEANFRAFHNDIIIENGDILEACGRL